FVVGRPVAGLARDAPSSGRPAPRTRTSEGLAPAQSVLPVKLALISEVHANVEALQATLNDIAPQSVDRIVCLGDIVGYNTNPGDCIALLRDVQALCIAGNHDRAVCGQI